jgi:mannose/fructose/N-acetylgalactosamine-specific phosphotransferase system component IIC
VDGNGLLLLALLGGVLELDRVAFLQVMASRPIVAGSIAGLLAGEATLGLLCGALLELVWIMDLPVGAAIPPNDTLAALLAAAFASMTPASWPAGARAGLGVLLALPWGYAGRALDQAVRRWNRKLLARARGAAALGRGPGRPHLAGAVAFFAAGVSATGLGALFGHTLLVPLGPRIPGGMLGVFEMVALGMPVVGVASMLTALRGRGHRWLFGAGFFGGLLLGPESSDLLSGKIRRWWP